MSDETKLIINKQRDEVRLGELLFEYDVDKNLLSIHNDRDEIIFAAGERCFPELWEGFLNDLERLMNSGPLLSALRQIREMGKSGGETLSQEEMAQVGVRALSLAEGVLDEYERTMPPDPLDAGPDFRDKLKVTTLESGGLPHGLHPDDVSAILKDEAASHKADVTPLNWQVTNLGDLRIVFVIYHFKGEPMEVAGESHAREGVRYAVRVNNGEGGVSGVVL